jgi:hypothetical protein
VDDAIPSPEQERGSGGRGCSLQVGDRTDQRHDQGDACRHHVRRRRSISTTTRCRLPLPIGAPEQEQITIDITNLEDATAGHLTEIVIQSGSSGGYSITKAFIGARDSHSLVDNDGGTFSFPSLPVAIAHTMLHGFSAEYLGLPEPAATRWSVLHREEAQHAWRDVGGVEPDGYGSESWAIRGLWHAAHDAAELAAAIEAEHVLTHMLPAGTGLGIALATSRPFDPEFGRYLDGARE